MKQPTKKQLKDQIAELRNDLQKTIHGLGKGELKEEMVKKYPYMNFYYRNNSMDNFIKVYGDDSYKSFMQVLQNDNVDSN